MGLFVVRDENETPPRTRLPVGVFGWVFSLSVAPGGAVVVPWGCHLRRPCLDICCKSNSLFREAQG